MSSLDSFSKGGSSSVLPPDGKLMYVSGWRHAVVWGACGWFALMDLSVAGKAVEIGGASALGLASFALLNAAFALRIPRIGLRTERDGVRLRTPLWSYRWPWYAVDRFELLENGAIFPFRICLRNEEPRRFTAFSEGSRRRRSAHKRCSRHLKSGLPPSTGVAGCIGQMAPERSLRGRKERRSCLKEGQFSFSRRNPDVRV
jgi:hypothetical protein